jgi:integrase
VSVRKRTWKSPKGEAKEAWVVDYVDQQGKRRTETFARKKDADTRHAAVRVDVAKGVHTPLSGSITVARAADDWITYVELENRERATLAGYRQIVNQHIAPRIGNEKLAKLSTPRINAFRDELLRTVCSRGLARKVLTILKMILKDARRRGNVATNAAEGVSVKADRRAQGRLEVGRDIPTPDEISRMLGAATGHRRAFLVTAVFTGLRSSELRGLRWLDVDLVKGQVHVRQRADCYGAIGHPKSRAGSRTIPIGPFVVNTLREWRLTNSHELVFPTKTGNVDNRGNILRDILWPAQKVAGVTGAAGKPKYMGLHALRHFFASWCINRKADGGLELPAKMVQERLGHASIVMTMDTYSHLFPVTDDGAELARAELRLVGSRSA